MYCLGKKISLYCNNLNLLQFLGKGEITISSSQVCNVYRIFASTVLYYVGAPGGLLSFNILGMVYVLPKLVTILLHVRLYLVIVVVYFEYIQAVESKFVLQNCLLQSERLRMYVQRLSLLPDTGYFQTKSVECPANNLLIGQHLHRK